MRYIFLVNSFSLKENTNDIISKILEVSERRKLNYKIEVNSNFKSTEEIIADYEKDKCVIMCIGGDGTINRTLNSIVGTKNILGYIPYGTGNDFYRSNKELLKQGVNNVDLIRINDKYFINVACFGIDADIANTDDIIHSSVIPEGQRYNASIVKNFLSYKPRHLKVEVDGETYENDYTTVALCNARYYGGGYKIGTNALLDDGLIDIYLVDKMPKLKMAGLLLGMKKGKHENSEYLKVLKSKKVYIESPTDIKCNIDGDVIEAKKFYVELIPKGIKVYYDQELIDEITNYKGKKR